MTSTTAPSVPMTVTREELCEFLVDEFRAKFKTDEEGFEEIFRRLNEENAIRCKHCGSIDLKKEYGSRVVHCKTCKKTTWFTAGTFFENIRSSLLWLLAIFLMEHGVVPSAAELARLAGVASSTAQAALKKILFVAQTKMGSVSAQEMYSAEFVDVICKRSRETPAGEHPRKEEDEMEQRANREEASAQCFEPAYDDVPTALDSLQKDIYELLSEEPIHFDHLCVKTGRSAGDICAGTVLLELAGLAERKPGDWYIRRPPKKNKTASPDKGRQFLAAVIMSFISDIFHGISRKYLQFYLAAYWCSFDRVRWYPNSLLKECCRFGAIAYTEILGYVSPLSVQVMAIGGSKHA